MNMLSLIYQNLGNIFLAAGAAFVLVSALLCGYWLVHTGVLRLFALLGVRVRPPVGYRYREKNRKGRWVNRTWTAQDSRRYGRR